MKLTIEDLKRMCIEGTDETTVLEFKPCNELIVGTEFYDENKKEKRLRTRDDILFELTRDVTAILNAAGGTIIYGIREKNTRASGIDQLNSFTNDSAEKQTTPEKVTDWLRSHILPKPNIDIYRIFEDESSPNSHWYLVLDIPQGSTAYQAKDLRFYRRSGSSIKPMEQYEVFEVMHRTSLPDAEVHFSYDREIGEGWHRYKLLLRVENISDKAINNFKIQFIFPNYQKDYVTYSAPHSLSDPYYGLITVDDSQYNSYKITYRSKDILFPKDDINVCERINLQYKIDTNTYLLIQGRKLEVKWILFADDMPPKQGNILLSELNEY